MTRQPRATQFDERQVAIRGQVFWHGLLVAMGLLVVAACLQAGGVVWASGFTQNVLIILVVATVVATEAMLRDAFFARHQSHWLMIGLYGVTGLALIATNTSGALAAVGLARSDHVVFIVSGVLWCCIAVVGIVKEVAEAARRQR